MSPNYDVDEMLALSMTDACGGGAIASIRRSAALSAHLAALGLEPGRAVTIVAENRGSPAMAVGGLVFTQDRVTAMNVMLTAGAET